MSSEAVMLEVNGVRWKGWREVSVKRQLDAVAGTFSVSLTDKWKPDARALPVTAGMSCRILAGETALLQGYIDHVQYGIGAAEHSISISGRDATADMVDCSAEHSPGEWQNITIHRLAEILAKPFGIRVECTGDAGAPLPTVTLQPGETAWEALERYLRMRALLAMPDGKGRVQLAAIGAGRAVTALVQGQNVLSASASYDIRDRFSRYRVLAQQPGSNAEFGAKAAAVGATVRDPAVSRYRPLTIMAESQADAAAARIRADWERTVRSARSVTVNVTVQGWRQADGSLWPLNALVRATLPYLHVDADLLISSVHYEQNNKGTLCSMVLCSRDAYLPEPERKARASTAAGSGGSDLYKDAVELSAQQINAILEGEQHG